MDVQTIADEGHSTRKSMVVARVGWGGLITSRPMNGFLFTYSEVPLKDSPMCFVPLKITDIVRNQIVVISTTF